MNTKQEEKLREYAAFMMNWGGEPYSFGKGLLQILDGDLSWSDPNKRFALDKKSK